jgi:putative aldouronate transport system permease protein
MDVVRKTSLGGIFNRIPLKQKEILGRMSRYKSLYLMLIPFFLFYIIYKYVPMAGLIIAFKKYSVGKGILGSPWVGLKYFKMFFRGYDSWSVIRNTLVLSFYNIVITFPAPIIFALLLNELKQGKLKRITQTISYLPHFISTVIICGMVYTFLQNDGIVNILLNKLFGIEPISFLMRKEWFKTIYVLKKAWTTFGWGAIIYLATLTNIDPQLYESAIMDGAGRFRRVIHITLPGILPVITVMFILKLGRILFLDFESVLLLYNSATMETADIISTYVYRRGLIDRNFSYGTAVGLFQSVIGLILVVSSNKISKKLTDNGLW